MKNRIFYFLIFFSSLIFSQEKLSSKQIFFENNLAHKIIDNDLFTGTIEDFRKNHLSYMAEYQNGEVIKEFFYFNFQKKMNKDVEYKKLYYSKNIKVLEEIFHGNGEKFSTTEFDKNGKMKYFELLKNGKIILTQNFKDGKLDGKESCYDKKGNYQENYFKEGKLLK